ncbi:MAG: hypothetical protein AB9835_04530 [Eubacteriales bacterium]
MTHMAMNITKSIVTGVVVGATVGMITAKASMRHSPMRKNANRALRAVGSFVDNVQNMVK